MKTKIIPDRANIEIDFSLWESRSAAVNELVRYQSVDTTDVLLIYLLGLFLVISALLGFGFYLWCLKTQ